MVSYWYARVSAVWASAGELADIDVLAAIDALVAEREPDDASAVFEAASARDYVERDAASVALAALADYLPLYSASVRGYAIDLAGH